MERVLLPVAVRRLPPARLLAATVDIWRDRLAASTVVLDEEGMRTACASGSSGDLEFYIEGYAGMVLAALASDALDADTEPLAPTPRDGTPGSSSTDLGTQFEESCAARLREGRWVVSRIGGRSDQGVDLLATRDRVIVAVQCKAHSAPVGNGAVQQAFTGQRVHGAHASVVVASCGFTEAARDAARATGVLLLHQEDLTDLAWQLYRQRFCSPLPEQ